MVDILKEWLMHVVLPGVASALLAAAFALAWQLVERIKDERVRYVVRELVRAAEQIFGPKHGAEKLDYVKTKLKQRGLDRRVDLPQIEAMVNTEFPKFEVAPDAEGPGGPPPEFRADTGFDAHGE